MNRVMLENTIEATGVTPTSPFAASPTARKRSTREPLHERLAKLLLADISSGRLKPGDRLPTEAELSAQYGLSRVPVRQALEQLRQKGLIERFPSRGTFVCEPRATPAWHLQSVGDLARLGAEARLHVLDWREITPTAAARGFFGAHCQSVFRLRATRAQRGQTVFYLEALVASELGRELSRADLEWRAQIDVFEQTLSIQVDRALEEIHACAATPPLARRLGIAPGAPLLAQDIQLFGAHQRPLQMSSGYWRADAFHRRFELLRG